MLHPFPHQGSGEPMVELKQVNSGYEGHQILHDVDLKIMSGDFVGLLGPSGSGKTTLLRTILGSTKLYGGSIKVNGIDVSQKRPKIGYVPQLETIDWNFPVTVEEVVMMGHTMNRPLYPWHKKSEKKLASEIMDRLGIYHLVNHHIRDLSGGQQQRAFLARALVSNPSLLLLDEPTTFLDLKHQLNTYALLRDLAHSGTTVITVTHDLNLAIQYADRLIVLAKGVIAADGQPSDVLTASMLRKVFGVNAQVSKEPTGRPWIFYGANGANLPSNSEDKGYPSRKILNSQGSTL